jgi:hypothetical protein
MTIGLPAANVSPAAPRARLPVGAATVLALTPLRPPLSRPDWSRD